MVGLVRTTSRACAGCARRGRDDLALPPPAAIVFAAGRDKDARAMLAAAAIAGAARGALFVTRTRNERALSADELQSFAAGAGWESERAPDVAAGDRGGARAGGHRTRAAVRLPVRGGRGDAGRGRRAGEQE